MNARSMYLCALGAVAAFFLAAILLPLQKGKLPIRLGPDLAGGIIVTYRPDLNRRVDTCRDLSDSEVISRCKEVIADRLCRKLGTTPDVVLRDDSRIVATIPSGKDLQDIMALIGKTYHLTMRLVVGGPVEGSPSEGAYHFRGENYKLGDVVFSGDMLDTSEVKVVQGDPSSLNWADRGPAVQFAFQSRHAAAFGRFTKKNIGKTLAILLDDEIQVLGTIRSEIAGGVGVISGGYTQRKAEDTALLLRCGNLLAPLEIESVSAVGPTLGQQVRERGTRVFLLVLLSILAIILVAYLHRTWFLLAGVVSLFCFQLAIVGLLAYFGGTIDLPGIAGLVLSVGMGVDAFIIIFESLEQRLQAFTPQQISRNLRSIIREIYSFRREGGVLVHANLTTVIAVLLLLKADRVSFFAASVLTGVIASLYTVLVTREVLQRTYALAPDFGPSLMGWMRGKRFGLFRIWKPYLILSGVAGILAVYALVCAFTNGRCLRLGADFRSGTQIVCEASSASNIVATVDALRSRVAPSEVLDQALLDKTALGVTRHLITVPLPLVADPTPDAPTGTVETASSADNSTAHHRGTVASSGHSGGSPVTESPDFNSERDSASSGAGLQRTSHEATPTISPRFLLNLCARQGVDLVSVNSVDAKVSANRFFWSLSVMLGSLALLGLYMWFGQYMVDALFTPQGQQTFEPIGSEGWVSMGVLVALVHDLAFVILACWFLRIDVSLPMVAGFLTLIGYSVNDSVVLWSVIKQKACGREHEYRAKLIADAVAEARTAGGEATVITDHARSAAKTEAKRQVAAEALDIVTDSVDNVLSRSFLTSLTTLMAPLSILLMGLKPLADFAWVILVGTVAGTLSSLFILAAFALPTLRGPRIREMVSTTSADTGVMSDEDLRKKLG